MPFNKEIIVVDDNSNDETTDVVKRLANKYGNIRLLIRPCKMGIGSAYRDGFRLSHGDIIVQIDGDLSHDPRELPKLIKSLENSDLVIGSRYIRGGYIVSWTLFRRLLSSGANLLVKLMLGLRIRDCTSGYRAYRRQAFKRIIRLSRVDGFAIQVETAYIANRLGYRIAEVPCSFIDRKKESPS